MPAPCRVRLLSPRPSPYPPLLLPSFPPSLPLLLFVQLSVAVCTVGHAEDGPRRHQDRGLLRIRAEDRRGTRRASSRTAPCARTLRLTRFPCMRGARARAENTELSRAVRVQVLRWKRLPQVRVETLSRKGKGLRGVWGRRWRGLVTRRCTRARPCPLCSLHIFMRASSCPLPRLAPAIPPSVACSPFAPRLARVRASLRAPYLPSDASVCLRSLWVAGTSRASSCRRATRPTPARAARASGAASLRTSSGRR